MYSERMNPGSWPSPSDGFGNVNSPFWGHTCRFLYGWHFGATVFLLEIRKSPRAESIQLVEKLRGEGGGSAVHVHLWARCSEFVNQHFLILIITNKMGAFKEQRDSCFARLNEQAERCKKKEKKKRRCLCSVKRNCSTKNGPELSGVIFSTK